MYTLRLHNYIKKHENVGQNDQAALKLFSEDTKMVFEFCNLVVVTYGEMYGVSYDDFSKDKRFTVALRTYMHQKEEIKDMLSSISNANA